MDLPKVEEEIATRYFNVARIQWRHVSVLFVSSILLLVGTGLYVLGAINDTNFSDDGELIVNFALLGVLLTIVVRWRDMRLIFAERDRIAKEVGGNLLDFHREKYMQKEMRIPSPEFLGSLLGFLVPRGVRVRCFDPFLEDLKADRLEKLARTRSRRVKRWIEFCFYFRLCVTVVQSLGCYLGEALSKVAPFIRALFVRGGS